MRPPEIGLPYSGRLWQGWRWKFFLAFESKTQESLSLFILNNSIHGYISSSGN